ncbi:MULTISPECIES: XRE family transcriptional regulator [Erwinia]|uniref:XRE family transcriptional regulator n=1 Tax=Erwinia TaxID=551 RepID=UPI001331B7BA|nr:MULTISPECIES: XRE family transcriptional regulator [Erwinia]MBD8165434.1 XRE family transcriptional regulator [Erwinia persicina]MBP2157355.1 hypothetical protein [Erwinia rhapontici]
MTGYELRLWRKGMNWDRERAAEELGVCLRAYKTYENTLEVKRSIALATVTLSLESLMPAVRKRQIGGKQLMTLLESMLLDLKPEK